MLQTGTASICCKGLFRDDFSWNCGHRECRGHVDRSISLVRVPCLRRAAARYAAGAPFEERRRRRHRWPPLRRRQSSPMAPARCCPKAGAAGQTQTACLQGRRVFTSALAFSATAGAAAVHCDRFLCFMGGATPTRCRGAMQCAAALRSLCACASCSRVPGGGWRA